MRIKPIRTRIFREGEDLADFILKYIPKAKEGLVIAVTSKIVSLAERRAVVHGTAQETKRFIEKESEMAIQTKHVLLTVSQGTLMANAGIDESNADGKLILLPKDNFKTAKKLWTELRKSYKVKKLGIVITDSRTFPLRAGTTGMAMGYAGFSGIKDYRKTPDLFGRLFKVSRANIADGLAAAAVLGMGEGREQTPLVVMEGVKGLTFTERVDRNEIKIPIEDDMYLPLFAKFFKKK